MKRGLLVASTVAVALPACALAQGGHAVPSVTTSSTGASAARMQKLLPSFSKADTNDDGRIEWSEAKAAGLPRSIFRREDVHHDGKLTLTEWKLARVAMIPAPPLPKAASGAKAAAAAGTAAPTARSGGGAAATHGSAR